MTAPSPSGALDVEVNAHDLDFPLPPGRKPRGWQIEARDALRLGLLQYDAVLVSAATGTGKGTLIAAVATAAALRGHRVLVLAHREELVNEIPDRIKQIEGHPITGIVMADRDEYDSDIVCASVQSCTPARRARMGVFDLVLTDECHHATAPSYGSIYSWVKESNPDWKHIGFTATPFRSCSDGSTKGLGSVFQAMVYEYGIRDAIDAGDLVPFDAWNVSTEVDLSSVEIVAGDFDPEQLAKTVDTPKRNELVVRQYQERTPGQPALVFAASIAHAEAIAKVFREAGIRAEAVYGELPKDERRRRIAQYRRADGTLPVLVSKDLIFEGFDAPATIGVYQARPTRSRNLFQQMVGRGLRLHPGKTRCIFVALVDNGSLDLATAADLSDDGADEAKGARELRVDDRVRRRHHDDWGIGRVVEIYEDGLPRAKVDWPPSRVHKTGATLTLPLVELVRVPPEKLNAPQQLSIRPRDLRVHAYQVFHLLGEAQATPVGWYRYQKSLSAAGWLGASRVVMVIDGDGDDCAVWQVTSADDGPPERRHVVKELRSCMSQPSALAWAQEHLRALGVQVETTTAGWLTEPVTAEQAALLNVLGIRRDLSRCSRGEASALIDAAQAMRRIRSSQRSLAELRRIDRARKAHRRTA